MTDRSAWMGYDGSSGITGLYAPHDGLPPDYPVIEQQSIMACLRGDLDATAQAAGFGLHRNWAEQRS
jgi:hypothetical protein